MVFRVADRLEGGVVRELAVFGPLCQVVGGCRDVAGEAERLLDRGLALLAGLPEEERAAIAPQAMCLAACVAPDRACSARSQDRPRGKSVYDQSGSFEDLRRTRGC